MQRPSGARNLGEYVSARLRADGTWRVLFEVPARLRPSGWLPTTPLPVEGERRGDLNNPDEVARIQTDAKALYEKLQQDAGKAPANPAEPKIFATLIRAYQSTDTYKTCKARTRKGYDWRLSEIQAWADSQKSQPNPAALKKLDLERFLGLYDDRPTAKYGIRSTLKVVMEQAVDLGWRDDNPVAKIKVRKPKSKVTIWEQADVDFYAWGACCAGRPDLAALMLMEWEIGQRLTDAILFRRSLAGGANSAEYEPSQGVFRFWQSKTSSYVTIPVSARLRAVLAALEHKGSPYLFHDTTGRPFADDNRLCMAFTDVRNRFVVPAKGRRLVLRALRHSCVVQLARCGCTTIQIASITGHSLKTVDTILETYLPRDNLVAWEAQRMRGLIA